MQVKLRTIMAGIFGNANPGDVVELPDEVAVQLLKTRQAEWPGPDPLPEGLLEDGDENAALAPSGETATRRRKPS